jgi:signal transduction histidine kinase
MRTHSAPTGSPRRLSGPVRSLAYAITEAEARERERIALGLHDEIGQLLTLARLKLGELRQCPNPREQPVLLDDIGALLAQAARATRSATFDLSSPVLRLGLEQALRSLVDRLVRDSQLQVTFECDPSPPLPEAVLAVVFRGVRELCLNVLKHADARLVSITTRCDGSHLRVCVVDDGIGFRTPHKRIVFGRDGGFGLASAQMQMRAIGGRLDVRPGPKRGTCATIVLPVAL